MNDRYRVVRNRNLGTWEVWSVYGIAAGKGYPLKEDAQRHIDSGAADVYIAKAYPTKNPLLLDYVATVEHLARIADGH